MAGEAEGTRENPWQRALLLLGAYLLFRLLLGVIRLPVGTPTWVLGIAALVSALGGIGLPIATIAALVRANRSPRMALGLALVGLALWLGLLAGGRALAGPVTAILQDVGKIVAAAGVGVALAAAIREPNILLPAGLFAAFADFVVVNFGTVKHALSSPKGQALVQSVSAKIPSVHPRLPELTVGPADFLFLGIFLACAARFDMGLERTARVLAIVLAVSLVLVLLVGPVPALAPMSVAFIAANWKKFRLTKEEILGSVLVLVLMGGLFLGYFLVVYRRGR
jgi:hypothetical protein